MPVKRARSLLRAHPTHSEAEALVVDNEQVLSKTNRDMSTPPQEADEYDTDNDESANQQTSSSSSSGTTRAPIVSGNLVTTPTAPIVSGSSVVRTTSPIASGSSVTRTTAPIASGSSVTRPTAAIVSDNLMSYTAISLEAAVNILDGKILQMGNVIQNDPPISKKAAEQTQQTLFNLRTATILSDAVDAKLARLFLDQARDPKFSGTWQTHIQKKALILIRLRLHDVTFRSLVPQNEISIWPRKLVSHAGQPAEHSLLEIAEMVMKIYAPETAPQTKSIEQHCREAAFAY